MKWPSMVTLIRHDKSAYNALRDLKELDPDYREFKQLFDQHGPHHPRVRYLAEKVKDRVRLDVGDWNTPLHDGAGCDAKTVGARLAESHPLPDVIYASPYLRTVDTLKWLKEGWPALHDVPTFEDDRIREQEHGIAVLYNDWRLFHVFHPEQHDLFALDGSYRYRYPQGENTYDVRQRGRDFITMLGREYAGQVVLVISHHLTILGIRANRERWSAKQFIKEDSDNKPINCGVTIYRGMPDQGKDGRLVLQDYNLKLY